MWIVCSSTSEQAGARARSRLSPFRPTHDIFVKFCIPAIQHTHIHRENGAARAYTLEYYQRARIHTRGYQLKSIFVQPMCKRECMRVFAYMSVDCSVMYGSLFNLDAETKRINFSLHDFSANFCCHS